MPVDARLQSVLLRAIAAYNFPRVVYDFTAGAERQHTSMLGVEQEIRDCLLSEDVQTIKNGLSNVLYWGYARIGFRDRRVQRFREKVTADQLLVARTLFSRLQGPGVIAIKKLGMPEFSGLSFVSKVRMFLDPTRYVTLDKTLMRLRDGDRPTIFHKVPMSRDRTTIPITRAMEAFYEEWCNLCREIAATDLRKPDIRAADVERGVFYLIGNDQLGLAAEILAIASK